ncbi:MAG: hypothetical protein V3R84_04090 [Acidimicrobiia bacterium]
MSFKQTAGWAGLLAVVFFVLSLVLAGSVPAPEDSLNEIGEYLADDVGIHKLSVLFAVLAALPFIAFLAGFLVPFFKSDRENGEAYSIVIFGGALLLGGAATIANTALGTLLLRGGDGLDGPTVRGLWDLQQVAYGSAGIAITIFAGGIAMAVFRRKVMEDWVGWVATLSAATGALGLITLTNEENIALVGYAFFIVFLLFVLAVSIDMVRSTSDA